MAKSRLVESHVGVQEVEITKELMLRPPNPSHYHLP